jgi:hypothetical protein
MLKLKDVYTNIDIMIKQKHIKKYIFLHIENYYL